MAKSVEKISKKHKQFVDEYIANGYNATRSYLAVYKNCKNDENARVEGSKLLRTPNVRAYLNEKTTQLSEKYDITHQFLVEQYLALIKSCMTEGLDGRGTVKDRANWNKALQNLSKLCGLDAPTQVEHLGGIILNFPGVTSASLMSQTNNIILPPEDDDEDADQE